MHQSKKHDAIHVPSGRWRLGFVLTVVTVSLWSTVPIALSLLLDRMDAMTVTWYRFLIGFCVLGAALKWNHALPPLGILLQGKQLLLLAIAAVGLTGNFVLYVYALNFIPPGASQVVMQLAPLFVLLGGIVLFREPFRAVQGGGLCLLIVGLFVFFHKRVSDFSGNLTDYSFGAMVLLAAAMIWASYALAQKQLLQVCSSMGIMLVLYALGVVALLPFCSLAQIRDLSVEQYVVLGYSSANTLVAYGCFAEALRHWEASRISILVCVTPLLTLALSHPAHAIWPDRIMPDDFSALATTGAVLVVTGSMLAALGGRKDYDKAENG